MVISKLCQHLLIIASWKKVTVYINYFFKSFSCGEKWQAPLGAHCTLYPHCQLYTWIHAGLFEILNIVGMLTAELFFEILSMVQSDLDEYVLCVFFFLCSNHSVPLWWFLQWHGKLNAVSNLWHHILVSPLIFSLFQISSTVWQLNQNLFTTLYPKSLCINL